MPHIRLLHLEDEPSDVLLVRRALEQSGLDTSIQVARSREEFIAALGGGTFDVVLADHSIPGFDGMSAFQLLRSKDRLLPFILVSGAIGEEAATAALRTGVTDCVLKHRLDRLGDCIRRAVAEARAVREHAKAQENLRRSEHRFESALQSMAEGVLITDEHGVVTVANPSACRILGKSREQLIGLQIGGTAFYLNDALEPLVEDQMPGAVALRTGQPQQDVTLAIGRPNHSHTWIVANSIPLRLTESEPPYGIVTTLHDITERKQLEAELLQSQKMEAIGTLSGGIAHDFNNLLTSVLGFTQLLLEDIPADDPRRQDLEAIHQAGEKGAALTRQLLSFSRRHVIELSVVRLHEVTSNMERLLRRVIGEDIHLTVLTDPDLSLIKGDRGQLEQVLMNLAANARDAMPRGGRLTIETRNAVLDDEHLARHPLAKKGLNVMLAVTDTGMGIDPDVRDRIFEPFFTTKPLGKGTGLGLSTVYGIVRQFGGSVDVYSERGRGTTFRLYFPAISDEGLVAAPPAKADVVPARQATILLVEDDESLRGLITRVLHGKGHKVVAASGTAEEALKALGDFDQPADLVISDTVLPGMSGPEFVKHVRIAWPSARVLFVSGYTDDTVIRHGLLDAGQAFLAKPFSPESLERKVRQLLGAASAAS